MQMGSRNEVRKGVRGLFDKVFTKVSIPVVFGFPSSVAVLLRRKGKRSAIGIQLSAKGIINNLTES
jgi:hypothetical protein